MEPVLKKARITDHFRVALKPQDVNAQRNFKKQKKHLEFGKENIEVVTISDDEDEQLQKKSKLADNNNPIDISITKTTTATTHNNITTILKSSHNINHETTTFKKTSSINTLLQKASLENQLEENLDISRQHSSIINRYHPPPGIRNNIVDFDRSTLDDFRCEPHYAWDSFNYDREQELKFQTEDYLRHKSTPHDITPRIRAELVDWLVQLQNMFQLDHEPLYMAVKLADRYLMKKAVEREKLQLLFMTTLFISAKFDERPSPIEIKELLHIAFTKYGIRYTKRQLVQLEADILTTLNFDIRFPLSYGFLRRFAQCTRSDKTTLTLARYILECSLLDYGMIEELESKLAAGSLLLAFQILKHYGAWTETARFYTGYYDYELILIINKFKCLISKMSTKKSAIGKKYSHSYFLQVAKIPLPF